MHDVPSTYSIRICGSRDDGQAGSASNFCFARDFTEIDELTNIGVTALRFDCLNDNTLISIDGKRVYL